MYSLLAIFHTARLVFMSKMSSGLVGSEGTEKARPASTDQTDAAAPEPQYADQSTRSLPASKIVIVRDTQLKENSSIQLGVLTLTPGVFGLRKRRLRGAHRSDIPSSIALYRLIVASSWDSSILDRGRIFHHVHLVPTTLWTAVRCLVSEICTPCPPARLLPGLTGLLAVANCDSAHRIPCNCGRWWWRFDDCCASHRLRRRLSPPKGKVPRHIRSSRCSRQRRRSADRRRTRNFI